MAELYELPFFEDVLDWIKTLAKEDPESHLHVIATLERLQRWVRLVPASGQRGGRQIHGLP
ncbi:hypothetical protein QWL27_08710 [Streptomyces thermocarboxydus]|uniref:Uncharacterized protein n=1 Tax=Streptomyces cellulosae TaxID=1968 RepID=A0ABW6JBR2_STRCE|nr:hypothetical protein [Streptomyces thermocarboxydus]